VTSRQQRTLHAAPERIWEIIEDAHHMPRWWPGVTRVEAVSGDRFTQVFTTRRGRPVRVDLRVAHSEPPRACVWEQELEGTPFARVLARSVTEIHLTPAAVGTQVTIEQRQGLRGSARTGALLLRRASSRRLARALDGLQAIC
jgi:uncharacterized protein YndB with AHSA1/START domain